YPRPRDRKAFMEQPAYFEFREHLIEFLNEKSHLRGGERPLARRRAGFTPDAGVAEASDRHHRRNGKCHPPADWSEAPGRTCGQRQKLHAEN
ncbi:MAG TPA: hypothetical protein DCY13_13025, partial [Verrucomicrobiales bacterium]|nr:hypothetical protein [Verrucomicrobiales bacterium]